MEPECKDGGSEVGALASLWQSGGVIRRTDLEAAVEHVRECVACKSRYGTILMLIERDVRETDSPVTGAREAGSAATGNATPSESLPEGAPPGFLDRAMARVGDETPYEVRRFGGAPRSRAPRLRVAMAAAAILIVGLSLALVLPSLLRRSNTVTVVFSIDAPHAASVSLTGDFTGWSPVKLTKQRSDGEAHWQTTIKLKAGKVYLYNFIINGSQWVPDPSTGVQVDDGFGGTSTMIQL